MLIYFRAGHRAGSSRPGSLALHRQDPRSDPDARMGWLIIIGSIPIVVLGLLFQDQIETTFRDLWIIAIALVVFAHPARRRRPRRRASSRDARAT